MDVLRHGADVEVLAPAGLRQAVASAHAKAAAQHRAPEPSDWSLDASLDGVRHCRIVPMFTFVETRLFTRLVGEYLTDAEYAALQATLMARPEAGAVVPGSGGVRKLRWAAPGRGKRGGYRVVYYVVRTRGLIWMLTMYPKNVADDIPANVLRQIRKEIENG
jgi:mRNA-degrading endonuclease RelE of RelBE toxin-antitoxin system